MDFIANGVSCTLYKIFSIGTINANFSWKSIFRYVLSGMVGRVILAATSDLFYKGNRRTPLFITVCISIFFILILVMIITYNNECICMA